MDTITSRSMLNQLRDLLDTTERRLPVMHETPDGALQVIRHSDTLAQLALAARRPGVDTRAEENRVDILRRQLQSRAAQVVRLVRAADQADQLSDSPTWQMIQDLHTVQQRQLHRRLMIGGSVVLTLGLLLFVVLPWVFPAPPRANVDSVVRMFAEGDLPGALVRARAEQARVPTDADAALWVGVLSLRSGDPAAAETAWAQARQLLNNDKIFYFQRGTALIEVGLPDIAEEDARRLIALPGAIAEGYLLLGGVEEARGRVPEAMKALQQSADYARQADNPELEVMAKTRLALMLQSPPAPTRTP